MRRRGHVRLEYQGHSVLKEFENHWMPHITDHVAAGVSDNGEAPITSQPYLTVRRLLLLPDSNFLVYPPNAVSFPEKFLSIVALFIGVASASLCPSLLNKKFKAASVTRG